VEPPPAPTAVGVLAAAGAPGTLPPGLVVDAAVFEDPLTVGPLLGTATAPADVELVVLVVSVVRVGAIGAVRLAAAGVNSGAVGSVIEAAALAASPAP
jgi:hypothetical protein